MLLSGTPFAGDQPQNQRRLAARLPPEIFPALSLDVGPPSNARRTGWIARTCAPT